ncbi:MAG TPA: hypothetical protein P5081_14660 [Phycisphaerae bacterium]|nr:hypothetical protein [Phycisphaerae bacterium]HRW54112.1 hypothetical protein [Phycisphaerae bacterium]
MTPNDGTDRQDRAALTGDRQTLPDALSIGERVRRATLAATALHLIEVRRDGATRRPKASDTNA